jgi:hypothetical protein
MMTKYLESFLMNLRPAFSRNATFISFVIIFAGLIMRNDSFGVSSIIRALLLPAHCYPNLLHFFHSTAWSTDSLFRCWLKWIIHENVAFLVDNRIVLIGDHTKTPKDGRRIPAVTALHQESESASKPSFFRGHEWGVIALLISLGSKFFASPLKAEIHNDSDMNGSRIVRIVRMAASIVESTQWNAYLVLDAYFAVGSTFDAIKSQMMRIHVITRSKKSITAYVPAEKPDKKKRGRPKLYGPKLKLMELFDSWNSLFSVDRLAVYGKMELVKFLTLDLMWKPTKGMIRFFLFETSKGRIILMTSDLNMPHTSAMKLYCHRVSIEVLFDVLKNILGGLKYHFWSKYIIPVSRRPKKGKQSLPSSSNPEKTQKTKLAIEKFVNIQIIILGFLQLLALKFPEQIFKISLCWLRTSSSEIPSEFVTKLAVTNLIRSNLHCFGKDLITHFILSKQQNPQNTGLSRKVA